MRLAREECGEVKAFALSGLKSKNGYRLRGLVLNTGASLQKTLHSCKNQISCAVLVVNSEAVLCTRHAEHGNKKNFTRLFKSSKVLVSAWPWLNITARRTSSCSAIFPSRFPYDRNMFRLRQVGPHCLFLPKRFRACRAASCSTHVAKSFCR